MRVLAKIIFIFLMMGENLYSNSFSIRVAIDNSFIHTYKNKIGKWVQNQIHKNKNFIHEQCKKFECNEIDVVEINGNDLKKAFIFFPYSKSYLDLLLKKGYGRRLVDLDGRSFLWPVEDVTITSPFGTRNRKPHVGLDLSASIGTPVLAAQGGIVKFAGWNSGYGFSIIIEHIDGKETLYAHLSQIFLKEGDEVNIGQIIGLSGNTGRSTGPHLHFEVRYLGIFLNPENFLSDYIYTSESLMFESTEGYVFKEKNQNLTEVKYISPNSYGSSFHLE